MSGEVLEWFYSDGEIVMMVPGAVRGAVMLVAHCGVLALLEGVRDPVTSSPRERRGNDTPRRLFKGATLTGIPKQRSLTCT